MAHVRTICDSHRRKTHSNTAKHIFCEDEQPKYNEIKERLENAQQTLLSPFVTVTVRDTSGSRSTRNDNKFVYPLPNFLKHRLWRLICFESGHVVKFKCRCKKEIA